MRIKIKHHTLAKCMGGAIMSPAPTSSPPSAALDECVAPAESSRPNNGPSADRDKATTDQVTSDKATEIRTELAVKDDAASPPLTQRPSNPVMTASIDPTTPSPVAAPVAAPCPLTPSVSAAAAVLTRDLNGGATRGEPKGVAQQEDDSWEFLNWNLQVRFSHHISHCLIASESDAQTPRIVY